MKKIQVTLILIASILMLNCAGDGQENMKTNDMQKDNKVKIIAHRGGSNLAPENTLAAFKNAIDLGVDMIEIDVILSKDNEVIVIHDDSIDRTTNGSGVVKEMTLAEIKKYDAGTWFGPEYKGEKIPTLSEVFETLNGNAVLLIEIKDGDEKYPGLEKKVVNLIHKYNAKKWVIVQSFNEKSVLRVKEMDNEIETYFLLGRSFEEFFNKEQERLKTEKTYQKKYDGLALHHSMLSDENYKLIRKGGYGLFIWTVDDIEKMKELINLGVDGIITDSPDKLKGILNK